MPLDLIKSYFGNVVRANTAPYNVLKEPVSEYVQNVKQANLIPYEIAKNTTVAVVQSTGPVIRNAAITAGGAIFEPLETVGNDIANVYNVGTATAVPLLVAAVFGAVFVYVPSIAAKKVAVAGGAASLLFAGYRGYRAVQR